MIRVDCANRHGQIHPIILLQDRQDRCFGRVCARVLGLKPRIKLEFEAGSREELSDALQIGKRQGGCIFLSETKVFTFVLNTGPLAPTAELIDPRGHTRCPVLPLRPHLQPHTQGIDHQTGE